MSVTWEHTVGILVDSAPGWAGVWSLVFAARGALAELAPIPGNDDDLALTYAGLDLTYVLGEIEQFDPSTPGVAVTLEPAPGDGLGPVACALDHLLMTADRQVRDLAAAPDHSTESVLAAARVQGGLAVARARIAGGAR